MMATPSEVSRGIYGLGQVWMRGPGHSLPDSPIPNDAFWLLGNDGQSMVVIPSLELVVVRLGLTPGPLGYGPQPLVAAVLEALPAGVSETGAAPE